MKYLIVLTGIICSVSIFAQPTRGEGRGWTFFLEKFDTNQDGQISKDEFQTASQTRFTGIDSNGDAIITEDEFQSGMQERRGERGQRKGPGRSHGGFFKAADTNQDQSISLEEWNTFVDALEVNENGGVILGSRRREHAGQHMGPMAELDANENGIIEKDEFSALFQTLDLNSDEVIEPQELPRGPQAHGEGPGGRSKWIGAADTNRDRVITSEEWTLFVTQHQNEDGSIDLASILQGPMIDRMTTKLDQNQNGSIEVEEIQMIFDRMDRNDDGQISEEDRPVGRKGKYRRTRKQ